MESAAFAEKKNKEKIGYLYTICGLRSVER